MSPRAGSLLTLDLQCRYVGLPVPVAEYRFAKDLDPVVLASLGQTKPRQWAIDWAFLDQRLAVEIEGGYAIGGRHTSVKGFLGDLEKYAVLTCLGWRLLRVTPRDVRSGMALTWVQRALTTDLPAELKLIAMLSDEETKREALAILARGPHFATDDPNRKGHK